MNFVLLCIAGDRKRSSSMQITRIRIFLIYILLPYGIEVYMKRIQICKWDEKSEPIACVALMLADVFNIVVVQCRDWFHH